MKYFTFFALCTLSFYGMTQSNKQVLDNQYSSIQLTATRLQTNNEDTESGINLKTKLLLIDNIYFMASSTTKTIPYDEYGSTTNTQVYLYGLGARHTVNFEKYDNHERDLFVYYNLISASDPLSDIENALIGKNSAFEAGIGASIIQVDKPKEVHSLAIVINKYKGYDLQLSDLAFTTNLGYQLNKHIVITLDSQMAFSLKYLTFGLGIRATL